MVVEGEFFEEDEPVADVARLFDAGVLQLSNVARADEQEPVGDEGPCEFSLGWYTSRQGQPRLQLCGKPGHLRGIAFACDGCWSKRASRARTDDRSDERKVEWERE